MLSDVCEAVARTVDFAILNALATPQEVVDKYPLVLRSCDSLSFDDPAEALAYLAVHLPDRYCRVFQVLEHLLRQGELPVGRQESNFAVVDIGAGPGPGIFALRSFYAALSSCARQRQEGSVSTLQTCTIVERGIGMSRVMHYFAEQLILAERANTAHIAATAARPRENRYLAELATSAIPFRASYDNFQDLDLRAQHYTLRERYAREISDDLDISISSARRIAYEQHSSIPSAYAVAIMTNFITTTEAVPKFANSIQRLMRHTLVPGGIVIVLGGVGGKYPQIYSELDAIARESGLKVLGGFENPLQAGSRPDELALVEQTTRQTWEYLAARAENSAQVADQLRSLRAADIVDKSATFRLPKFQVRAYRNGR